MAIQVTPEQYQRLIKARDNWPDRLSIIAYDGSHPEISCTIAYLGAQIGLSREDISNEKGADISRHAKKEISRLYGVSEHTLEDWEFFNTIPMFGEERRSRKMLSRFERFLNKVEVTASETEAKPNQIALVYAFPSMRVNS